MPNPDLVARLDRLEAKLAQAPLGGMLSGKDIVDLVVEEAKASEYLKLFKARDWPELEKAGMAKKIHISPYSQFNVTPFSYDLSFGEQFLSIQKGKIERVAKGSPYVIDPGETIVTVTEEYIAIPMYYSATVWPRFSMVRQGLFQSMVKIDPTWYGKLAVAMTNVSPMPVSLFPGKSFATLLLYTLVTKSNHDLWEPTDDNMKEVEAYQELPRDYHDQLSVIREYIRAQELDRWLVLSGTRVRVYGVKRDELERIQGFSTNREWRTFCTDLANRWATATHKKTGRSVVWMEALGLEDLGSIATISKAGRLSAADLETVTCSDGDLLAMAERYGKPFDIVARIPAAVGSVAAGEIERVRGELMKRIDGMREEIGARVEATVMPRMVTLMFSVLGFISLITGVATLCIKLLTDNKLVPASTVTFMWSATIIVGGVTITGLLLVNWRTVRERFSRVDGREGGTGR